METDMMVKAAVAVVGSVQMLKNFTKTLKVPGFVWAILSIGLGVIYSLPSMPAWVLDAVVVVSAATLFYDTIVKYFEKKFTQGLGGNDE